MDVDGNLVGPGDRVAQTRQGIDNLGLALRAAEARWDGVLKTTVSVVADDRADPAAL